MTFDELLEKYDKFHAFDSFVSVKTAKYLGIIPKGFYDEVNPDKGAFPDHCECGSENIISMNLKQAQCCNPRCRIKMGWALSELFSRFKEAGIEGVGPAICADFINGVYDKLKYGSYVEALLIPYDEYPSYMKGYAATDKLYYACQAVKRMPLTFAQMVSKLGLAGFNASADKLISGVNCSKELQDTINSEGGMRAYCANRGVYDPYKIMCFYESMRDIVVAEQVFKQSIRREGITKVDICITGSLAIDGEKLTKSAFVLLCNQAAQAKDGMQLFEIKQTTAIESVPYVVADYESGSRKYLRGKERGVLITSKDLLNLIKTEVDKYNNKLQEEDKTKCQEMKQF